MSTIRQCDRCGRALVTGEGTILVVHDTANHDAAEYESSKPDPIDYDLCGNCRILLGEFLGIDIVDDIADAAADI